MSHIEKYCWLDCEAKQVYEMVMPITLSDAVGQAHTLDIVVIP